MQARRMHLAQNLVNVHQKATSLRPVLSTASRRRCAKEQRRTGIFNLDFGGAHFDFGEPYFLLTAQEEIDEKVNKLNREVKATDERLAA